MPNAVIYVFLSSLNCSGTTYQTPGKGEDMKNMNYNAWLQKLVTEMYNTVSK